MKREIANIVRFCLAAAAMFVGLDCSPVTVPSGRPEREEPAPVTPVNDTDTDTDIDSGTDSGTIVLAYVSSWTSKMPDPSLVTHINYAFGHVTDNFKSVRIDNESRLNSIIRLKDKNPSLKVLLSVGGAESGNFSEMAADENFRKSFCKDCKAVVDRLGLDGIDIDWEFPGHPIGNISSSPDDTENFTLLMRDLRSELGDGALLTYASASNADYVNVGDIIEYVDFVNAMEYDMGYPPNMHDAALYRSSRYGCWISVDEGIKAHLNKGVPKEKLVMGMPFFGRGTDPYGFDVAFSKNPWIPEGYSEGWDDTAKEPYIADSSGKLVLTFENERSISEKCKYIKASGLKGGMYWELGEDDSDLTLSKVVAGELL